MNAPRTTVTRRTFLKTAAGGAVTAGMGAGLIVPLQVFAAPPAPTFMPGVGGAESVAIAQITPWIRIAPDGTVIMYLSQSEMGQGISTGLTQMLADELDADWDTIRLERAPVTAPYQVTVRGRSFQGTFASTSTALIGPAMKTAGAAARQMLMQAGANSWGVPLDQVTTDNSVVIHASTGRRLSYGALAEAAGKLPVPGAPALKTRAQYRYVGKPMKRLDTTLKTNGSAVFGIDVRVPNMLFAAVRHAPVQGAQITSSNADAVRAMPGVKAVVPVPNALVVVADSFWQAQMAANMLEIAANGGVAEKFSSASYSQEMRAALDGPALPSGERGQGAAVFKTAAKVINAEFELPCMAHAPLEPPCATADVRADGATFWLPIQQQTFHVLGLSKVLNLKPEQIRINTTYIGGSFGRKNPPDFAIQAALASKAVGRPVKLIWNRAEDIQHDKYRPAFMGRFSAALDEKGQLIGLNARLVAQSLLEQVNPAWIKDGVDETTVEGTVTNTYSIPNMAVESVNMKAPVPLYFWRSVGNSPNVFMLESFLDEIALQSRTDPYKMRRDLLAKDPRGLAVLDAVARSAGWGGRKLPAGRALGIAYFPHRGRADSYVTRVAQVAEVSVDKRGNVRVHHIHLALDTGLIINPKLVEAQMQSGIGWGLTQAFKGKITFKDGRVQQSNFHDYPVLTLAEMPKVTVTLIDSDQTPGGVGEIPVPPVGPAVANAIFAASGKRMRRMPFSEEGMTLVGAKQNG